MNDSADSARDSANQAELSAEQTELSSQQAQKFADGAAKTDEQANQSYTFYQPFAAAAVKAAQDDPLNDQLKQDAAYTIFTPTDMKI